MIREEINWAYVFDSAFWLVLFIYAWFHKDWQNTFELVTVTKCAFILIELKYREKK